MKTMQPISVENFKTPCIIPQGILKRKTNYKPKEPIELAHDDILPLFNACVTQMKNTLVKVRTTFAGWTTLSSATTGGGSKSKSKTKKNRHSKRRSNRRKY
jgi:hypothetical protein